MESYHCKVSVIIPVYNAEKYLRNCLNSIVKQEMPKDAFEVLMVNDGSSDNSLEICYEYSNKYCNFNVLVQENKGVSAARNNGIRNARGEYLMFLDSDDMLSTETIKNVTEFFDEHYDEVDIVTYNLTYLHPNGKKTKHYRNNFLKNTAVYDVSKKRYIHLTTMNIMVKNTAKYFDESVIFHEDELYIAELVMQKEKFGYVSEAEYIYLQHENSSIATKTNPYYIFEQSLKIYEDLFQRYADDKGYIAPYIQELVLNDFNWKLKSDVLYPYHYTKSEFDFAVERVKSLLKRIDEELILEHPNIDIFHKYYFLKMQENDIKAIIGNNGHALIHKEVLLYYRKDFEVVLQKIKVVDSKLTISGYLKSPLFSFLEKPKMYIVDISNEKVIKELPLYDSSWSYYKTKVKTNVFYDFYGEIELGEEQLFKFSVGTKGVKQNVNYYFLPSVAFNSELKRYRFYQANYEISISKGIFKVVYLDKQTIANKRKKQTNKTFFKQNKKIWAIRRIIEMPIFKRKKIWLYYDCHGVKKDNGYYQFMHDFYQNDGIVRFFVINDELDLLRNQFNREQQKYLIRFGSSLHKFLYLKAEKIITAYIEENNYLPFSRKVYAKYQDLVEHEIVYLQHGILHAHLPWKYSLDRQELDREVISTRYEEQILKDTYGFKNNNLIKAGMPRYDYINVTNLPKRKILFAPSWRKYLINRKPNGQWSQRDNFIESNLYKEWIAFLTSPVLNELLEKYNYILDFKLHPIFECYAENFKLNSSRVNIVKGKVEEQSYKILLQIFHLFILILLI